MTGEEAYSVLFDKIDNYNVIYHIHSISKFEKMFGFGGCFCFRRFLEPFRFRKLIVYRYACQKWDVCVPPRDVLNEKIHQNHKAGQLMRNQPTP